MNDYLYGVMTTKNHMGYFSIIRKDIVAATLVDMAKANDYEFVHFVKYNNRPIDGNNVYAIRLDWLVTDNDEDQYYVFVIKDEDDKMLWELSA